MKSSLRKYLRLRYLTAVAFAAGFLARGSFNLALQGQLGFLETVLLSVTIIYIVTAFVIREERIRTTVLTRIIPALLFLTLLVFAVQSWGPSILQTIVDLRSVRACSE